MGYKVRKGTGIQHAALGNLGQDLCSFLSIYRVAMLHPPAPSQKQGEREGGRKREGVGSWEGGMGVLGVMEG